MCGRYRLSRRKGMLQDYFETANEVEFGASLQRRTLSGKSMCPTLPRWSSWE